MPMTPIRLLAGCVAAAVAFIAAATAMAQSPPTRIRGTISAIDGKTATIATREGTPVKVNLADNWGVMLVSPLTMADIKENSFVGIASMKGPDGSLNALEVLVFPEAARGSNEGHYPWDLQPESMMTNATVATVASANDGQTLTLKHKDGTQTIKVKPGTPIVTFAPGDKADAKVGAKVFFGTTKAADGSLTTARMLVGKDGLTPPM
jgi:endonuclease YncB( thermonuclease family)